MALSVVYFRITHHLGRPHYTWGEYLYSVWEKIEVRVTVSVTVCIVWDDDERMGEGETRCRLVACSSRKAPRGPPGLTDESLSTVLYAFSTYILPHQGLNPGPAEPEADMLPSEPAWRAHLHTLKCKGHCDLAEILIFVWFHLYMS